MDAAALAQYITDTFVGVDVVLETDNYFFFYDPGSNLPPDHRFPFATIVTNDSYDQVSDLNRPSVFRLNVGVSKQTFLSLFGSLPGVGGTGHDFTALDQLMPHPIYGSMFWVCVLNPGATTFEKTKPLLSEAYNRAAHKHKEKA